MGGDATLTPPPIGCNDYLITAKGNHPMRTTLEGLIIMTAKYGTTELATAIMGEEKVSDDRKGATRTLRKFLRDEMGEGKSVVGKGGRYSLELKAAELRALTKKFAAWEIAQEEAKAARAEALAALKAPKAEAIALPADDEGTEDIDDGDDSPVEGPTDDEILAMMNGDDDEIEA